MTWDDPLTIAPLTTALQLEIAEDRIAYLEGKLREAKHAVPVTGDNVERYEADPETNLAAKAERHWELEAKLARAEERIAVLETPKSTWVGGVCPDYYRIPIAALGIEITPFDIIESRDFNFSRGSVLKYVLRAGRKGPALPDLKKARNCLDREIARLEDDPPF